MMVVFHFLWDLTFFTDIEIVLTYGFWDIFRVITAFTFLFLAGMALYLSTRGKPFVFLKLVRRGLFIFVLGLLITAFSKIFFPASYIAFGILHLIGVSIILAFFFLRFKYLNFLLGLIVILAGIALGNYSFDIPFLFFLGFAPENLITLDYYPVFPWFGVVLWGIGAGKILYAERTRQFNLSLSGDGFLRRKLAFLGRHSLIIYFLHQPILFSFFYLLKVL